MRGTAPKIYATVYTMLYAWFIYQQCSFFCHVTGNINCPIVYDEDTCRTYTRSKELSEIVSKCWCFRRECECDNLIPRVLSGDAWVSKWHIWILKPITKPFGYPQVIKWKRKKNDTKRRKKENLNLLCVPVLVPGWLDNKQTFWLNTK